MEKHRTLQEVADISFLTSIIAGDFGSPNFSRLTQVVVEGFHDDLTVEPYVPVI